MERLFSPCTRLHDRLERLGHLERLTGQLFQELNLDVSTEELLSVERAFTYADLYAAVLGNEFKVAWFTPHAAVASTGGGALICSSCLRGDFRRFSFNVDGQKISALARSSAALSEIVDVLRHLLVANASEVYEIALNGRHSEVFFSAPSFAYLVEHCQNLKSLTLERLYIDENHCLVLGAYSRPDLEIVLKYCNLTSAGTSALAEIIGSDRGPTKLDCCFIDNFVLANGLRGNSRLKSLTPYLPSNLEVGIRDLLAIAGALRENKGLVDLDLSIGFFRENDETWGAICDSLETHPTLEVLNLSSPFSDVTTAPAVITSRVQALLNMMKMNLSIHTIHLRDHYSEHQLFRGSVVPYLETNRLRPRLLAIQKTRPLHYRVKVLGRALLSARTNANSFWMLLSGNAEVAFPSTTAMATPAANLPTPATPAATSNATDGTVAALSPTTGSASTISVSVVDSVATPTFRQKRKSRP
jgi:hypothetical protein